MIWHVFFLFSWRTFSQGPTSTSASRTRLQMGQLRLARLICLFGPLGYGSKDGHNSNKNCRFWSTSSFTNVFLGTQFLTHKQMILLGDHNFSSSFLWPVECALRVGGCGGHAQQQCSEQASHESRGWVENYEKMSPWGRWLTSRYGVYRSFASL